MDVKSLNGRFRLSLLFWITGIIVFLVLNLRGKSVETGGGFSINGLEIYEKFEHGFPAKMLVRTIDNRESAPWAIWDSDELEFTFGGIATNGGILIALFWVAKTNKTRKKKRGLVRRICG